MLKISLHLNDTSSAESVLHDYLANINVIDEIYEKDTPMRSGGTSVGKENSGNAERNGVESKLSPLSYGAFIFDVQLFRARLAVQKGDYRLGMQAVSDAFEIHSRECLAFTDQERNYNDAVTNRNKSKKIEVAMRYRSIKKRSIFPLYLLKARINFLMGEYETALQTITESKYDFHTENANKASGRVFLLNTLGCVHYRLGKPALSGLYFGKSLKSIESSVHGKSDTDEIKNNLNGIATQNSMGSMNDDTSLKVMSNISLSLHAVGDQLRAAQTLRRAVQFQLDSTCAKQDRTKVKLWIRLAESLLGCRPKSKKSENWSTSSSSSNYQKVDDGFFHVESTPDRGLTYLLSNNNNETTKSVSMLGGTMAPCGGVCSDDEKNIEDSQPLLYEATQCLHNALNLLLDPLMGENGDETKSEGGNSGSGNALGGKLSRAHASSPDLVECVCLKLIYVALCSGKPGIALKRGRIVSGLKRFGRDNPHHDYLAKMYMAEALCELCHGKEALEILQSIKDSYYMSSISEIVSSDSSAVEVAPDSKLPSYRRVLNRAMLMVNLANTQVLRGNTKKAHECVDKAFTIVPNFAPATRLKMYLYLKEGRKVSLFFTDLCVVIKRF